MTHIWQPVSSTPSKGRTSSNEWDHRISRHLFSPDTPTFETFMRRATWFTLLLLSLLALINLTRLPDMAATAAIRAQSAQDF